MNVSGAWDYGWNFNNKISSPDATVYFPVSGYRSYSDGSLNVVGIYGYFWSAVLFNTVNGCYLNFGSGFVSPLFSSPRACGFAARPVADE